MDRNSFFLELNKVLCRRSLSETNVSELAHRDQYERSTIATNGGTPNLLSPQSMSKDMKRSQHSCPNLPKKFDSPKSPKVPKKPMMPPKHCARSTSTSDVTTEGRASALQLQTQGPSGHSAPNLLSPHIVPMAAGSPLIPKLSLNSWQESSNSSVTENPNISLMADLEQASNGDSTDKKNKCKCISPCGVQWEPNPSVKVDMLKIVWFHPNLTRHQAEAELRNSEKGVYLLRPVPSIEGGQTNGYSLDVRSSDSVKHFKVSIENGDLVLGAKHFGDVESFLEYFDSQPSINTDCVVVCRHPYPREIDEIHDYYILTNHFVPTRSKRKRIAKSLETRTFSLCSKEGYLLKVGQRVRSWKRRWFVLKDNYLRYHMSEKHTEPKKVIPLKDINEVSPCDFPGRLNIFQLVTSYRIFYIQAPSAKIMEDWLQILEFKMDELKKAESERRKKESLETPPVRVFCTC